MTKSFLFFLGLLILPMHIMADEARPVYVEVEQISEFKYALRWKIPPVMREGAEPQIVLRHHSCAPLTNSRSKGLLGRMLYECGQADLIFDVQLIYPEGNPALTSLVVFKSLSQDPQQIFSGPEITSITMGSNDQAIDVSKQYLFAGIEHILEGYDHLLFILCLLIIARSFKRLILTVTGFTVAHSITLSLATLNIVRVRTELVELLIALSILLLAVEIIKQFCSERYDSFTWRYPISVSSLFGLLHGFGFAVVLQELGLPQSMKIHALLFFNIGVELGQILFIVGVTTFAYALYKIIPSVARHEGLLIQLGVYFIGSCSAYWLIERAGNTF